MALIDFEEAANRLGVSKKTIGRMCDRGELVAVSIPGTPNKDTGKVRNMRRVDEDEIRKRVKSWAQQPAAKKAAGSKAKALPTRGRGRRQAL